MLNSVILLLGTPQSPTEMSMPMPSKGVPTKIPKRMLLASLVVIAKMDKLCYGHAIEY